MPMHTLLTTPLRSLGISKASKTQVGTKIVIEGDGRHFSRQELVSTALSCFAHFTHPKEN